MPHVCCEFPPYAPALLTGTLRRHGFTVFQKDFENLFLRRLPPEEKRILAQSNNLFWSLDRPGVEGLADRHDDYFTECVRQVLADEPDVVGFSVWFANRPFAFRLAERLKWARPSLLILMGGPDTEDVDSYRAPWFIDAVCRNEADVSLPAFLAALERDGRPSPVPGFGVRSPGGKLEPGERISDLPAEKDIAFADYSDYDFELYPERHMFTTVMSRGCVYRCSFCTEAPMFTRHRFYEPERVWRELESILATTNVARPAQVKFNDSLMNGSLEALEGLADRLIARPLGPMRYSGLMTLSDALPDPLVAKLARSGLSGVFFGLESASEVVLRMMGKRIDLREAERVIRNCAENGIVVTLSLVIGHPGETDAEFDRTLRFLERTLPYVGAYHYGILQLHDPNTRIRRHPEKFGIEFRPGGEWIADGGTNTPAVRLERIRKLDELTSGKEHSYRDDN